MTTAIEVTKREMYAILSSLKHLTCKAENGNLKYGESATMEMQLFESRLEHYLEALRQDRAALVAERDTLRNRVQVLELANQTSGEVIRGLKEEATQSRRARMKARLHEYMASASTPAENVASAALEGKTKAILGAVVDCQRIVTNWSLQEIKAKNAMYLISDAVHAAAVKSALYAFEKASAVQPKEEVTGSSLSAKYFSGRTIASVAIDKMVKDAMRHGTGWIRMTSSEDGVEITNLPADEMLKKPGCQHSFHFAHEHCIYCGVRK